MTDLDARVAALMDKFVEYRYAQVGGLEAHRTKFEKALRAELQKPALHEPVSDQETIDAIRACHLKVTTESMIGMRRTLESFLQGRAKPAAPVTQTESTRWPTSAEVAAVIMGELRELESAAPVELPKLPEPDTTHYAQWAGDRIKYHSVDQIIEFANARVTAALAAAQKGKS